MDPGSIPAEQIKDKLIKNMDPESIPARTDQE